MLSTTLCTPYLHNKSINSCRDYKFLGCARVAEIKGIFSPNFLVDRHISVRYQIRCGDTAGHCLVVVPYSFGQIYCISLTSNRIIAVNHIHPVVGDNARTLCVAEGCDNVCSCRIGAYNDGLVETVGNAVGHVARDTVTERRSAHETDIEHNRIVVADAVSGRLQSGYALIYSNGESSSRSVVVSGCDMRSYKCHGNGTCQSPVVVPFACGQGNGIAVADNRLVANNNHSVCRNKVALTFGVVEREHTVIGTCCRLN